MKYIALIFAILLISGCAALGDFLSDELDCSGLEDMSEMKDLGISDEAKRKLIERICERLGEV